MESRTKEYGECSQTADAIHGQAVVPYNAKGVDSIPSPSVLDKNNGFQRSRYFLVTRTGISTAHKVSIRDGVAVTTNPIRTNSAIIKRRDNKVR